MLVSRCARRPALQLSSISRNLPHVRYASLISAIERGRRRETNGTVRAPGTKFLNRQDDTRPSRHDGFDARRRKSVDFSEERAPMRRQRSGQGERSNADKYPISVPYSAADSQFIYGSSAVVNAMQAGRRKLHKLYIAKRDPDWLDSFTKPSKRQQMLKSYTNEMQMVSQLAKSSGVEIVRLDGPDRHRLLDKMSTGRPHNGYILEASPVPAYVASGFSGVESITDEVIKLHKGGSSEAYMTIPTSQPGERFPLVLYLDGVNDPGNLGNIIRTAYFLGVDTMILNDTCSQISPVVLKAAAGAAERMPLIRLEKGAKFLENTRAAGWKVFAAVPPPDGDLQNKPLSTHLNLAELRSKKLLGTHPAILLLGSEGEGLKSSLESKADFSVGILGLQRSRRDSQTSSSTEIDSLNVAVAASLVTEALLTLPNADTDKVLNDAQESTTDDNIFWTEQAGITKT